MDRQILNITANEQILTCDNPIKISTNKVNYIEVHFTLGDNWSGYDSVRAVWFNDFYCISTVLDSNGVAFVPSEVMKRNGKVKVNLVGSISENDVLTDRLTSYPIVAVIVDCTAQINGAETAPITPSQFEQYVAIVRGLVDSVKDIDHIELNSDYTLTIYYSDGTSDTTGSVRGADGNGIESVTKTGTSGLVDTYTITFTDGQTTAFNVTNGAKGDTGNGISSIEKTSTVGLVDTYTITYTNGTTTTFTVTNGEKGDKGDTGEVSLSELEDATVVQTLSDTEPYNYRRTNNGNGAGHREYDEIVGASVGWNQIVQNGATSVTIPSGHKYYALINNVASLGTSDGTAIAIDDSTKDMVIDLTLMLGSTIANYAVGLGSSSGVTWLKTHFPKLFDNGYQPFDSGSIKSVSGLTAHEMVGKNLFDKTMHINSGYRDDGGSVQTSTGSSYTDAIKAFPNTAYTLSGNFATSGYASRVYYLTSDGDWISRTNSIYVSQFPYTFTTPSNCSYIQIQLATASTLDTAQLEFGSTATSYEPYQKHTYPLDSSVELRGKFRLDSNNQLYADGDIWKSVGEIDRSWKEVDLGSLNYSRQTAEGVMDRYLTTDIASDVSKSGKTMLNLVCAKFVADNDPVYDRTKDNCMVVTTPNGYLYISASGYASASAFKTAMSGTKLVYKTASVTTEIAPTYENPQWCDSHGTEEYVGSELPVGHNTDYPMTLIDTADGLSNGTYEPRITVANGKKTVTWVSV